MPTLEELQAQNEELERRLRKYKGMFYLSELPIFIFKIFYRQTEISQRRNHTHPRPKGEVGSRKRGFILYTAMGMDKVENRPVVYDRIRVCL